MGSEPARSRRQFLKGAVVLGGVAGLASVGVWRLAADTGKEAGGAPAADAGTWLDSLAQNVVSGGPGKDGIPPIDEPRFVDAAEMRLLNDDSPVFGLTHRGVVRAYPQIVLVWHEIVNDRIAGERISMTYCPLTGSAFGVRGRTGTTPLTFGTTGRLVNSNLLMYDRQTDSEWPQLAMAAIQGSLRGERLDVVPLVWSTWGSWRAAHPDTEVLSTDTGHIRDYGRDPYGSYTPLGGYYRDDGLMFPVQHESDRFAPKDVVVAAQLGDRTAAVAKDAVSRRGRIEFTLADVPLVAVWDDPLGAARVQRRDGKQTPAVAHFDVMWFAWYAFHPDTKVIE